MLEIKYFYLIRCDLGVVLGLDSFAEPDLLSYVSELHLGAVARDVGFTASQDLAVKFGSWDEAAAVAIFIIHHIDDRYTDALDIVCIDS